MYTSSLKKNEIVPENEIVPKSRFGVGDVVSVEFNPLSRIIIYQVKGQPPVVHLLQGIKLNEEIHFCVVQWREKNQIRILN